MQNPFTPSFDLEPEGINPIPPGVLNVTRFLQDYERQNALTPQQTLWFTMQLSKFVPFYVLCLWQGYPEWEITQRLVKESGMQFSVATERTNPRFCSFSMRGVRLSEIVI